MRDMVFKNLTSHSNKRRIITSSETADNQGVHSIIKRHFIYMAKEVHKDTQPRPPMPCIYVLKERNTKEQSERFYCRMKGSVYAKSDERLFLISFVHSLKITMIANPHSCMGLGQEEVSNK